MSGIGWWDYFSAGSTVHLAMVTGFGVTATLVITAARRLRGSPWLAPLETAMIVVLAVITVGAVVKDMLPGATTHHWLPLQICDLTGLCAWLALAIGRRPLRVVLHYWGLTMAIQGFIFPPITCGPAYFQFWSHFVGHGAIVGAALYDLFARDFRPTWRDWQWMLLINVLYVGSIFSLDLWSGWNYGFLGDHPHPVLDGFGNWPQRVPLLLFTACLGMAGMTAVAQLASRRQRPLLEPEPALLSPGNFQSSAVSKRHASAKSQASAWPSGSRRTSMTYSPGSSAGM